MRIRIFNFLLLFIIGFALEAQDIYFVNHAAQGNDDGSTWENAFTSLDSALANVVDNDIIWIATGTYRPGGNLGDSTTSFVIDKAIRVFGGFRGDETSVDDRDLAANPVVLDGDHMENDVAVTDSISRLDNSWHLVRISPNLDGVVRLSDLVFNAGSSRSNRNVDLEFAGGAILARNQVLISNCLFTNNYALSGGCIAFLGGSSDSQVSNCLFQGNYSDAQSACIFSENTFNIRISGCEFKENITTRGVIYPLRSINTEIDQCRFENNDCASSTGFGGAIFLWNSVNTIISNSEFEGNDCGNGGTAYIDGRELDVDVISAIWDNCRISDSRALDWGGGAFYNWRSTQIIRDCEFNSNTAANTGGALYNGGNSKNITITNTLFADNIANGGWGGAHAIYGDSTTVEISGCTYEANIAITSGGAVTTGFLSEAIYTNCEFLSNSASFGGASYTQNDSTGVQFVNCSFLGNTASTAGGAINIAAAGDHEISKCHFELNVSEEIGGAINVSDPDAGDLDTTRLMLTQSRLIQNLAETQGAGISMGNTFADIINTEITDNTGLGTGYGAAISQNSSSGMSTTLNIVNSTIANNNGLEIEGISSWTDTASTSELNIVNSILHHSGGTDWGIEDGSPVIQSLGGNLVSTMSLSNTFDQTNDEIGESPEFADMASGNYKLADNSPAVNTGLSSLAPDMDLNGNPRVGEADKGAYENQNVTSTKDLRQSLGAKIIPNPMLETGYVALSMDHPATLNFSLLTTDGRCINQWNMDVAAGQNQMPLNLQFLVAGNYLLEISNDHYYESLRIIRK